MKEIIYRITYGAFYLFSLLPYRVLYAIADFFYLLVYRVVGYRKKVVRGNLTSSFPEKSIEEIKEIEKGFYHFLCDYFVETIKLLSISPKQMRKHMSFTGLDVVQQCYDEGQDCAGILGHYCNWEYLSTTLIGMDRYPDSIIGLIYHPLYNAVFDRLFLQLREHFHGVCIPKKDVLRYLIKYKREGRKSIFGYIADQTPKWENIHLWLPFLNHDTPVFTNGEKLMRKMNNAVFYVEIQRPKRGQYIAHFKLITRTPNQLEENAITKRFFELLEQTIRRDPRYYLWSHNRWKRTHEEFDREYMVVNGKVLPRNKSNN